MSEISTFVKTNHLAERLSGTYFGEIVVSDHPSSNQLIIDIKPLSDVLVCVHFEYGDQSIVFRAILSEADDDIHMIIQEKVTDHYVLNGVRGFLCQKPNVHGGWVQPLNSLYFHILFNHFTGVYREFYFLGRRYNASAIAV